MYYVYEVKCYDSDFEECFYTGVVFGASYAEALERVTKMYGEEDILHVALSYLDESPVLEIEESSALAAIIDQERY